MSSYDKAVNRVNESENLEKHYDALIAYDWNDENHFEWVATAPEAELIDWAETVS